MFDFGCHRIEVLVNVVGPITQVSGEIAKALFARAEELFSAPPKVESFEIITSKTA